MYAKKVHTEINCIGHHSSLTLTDQNGLSQRSFCPLDFLQDLVTNKVQCTFDIFKKIHIHS